MNAKIKQLRKVKALVFLALFAFSLFGFSATSSVEAARTVKQLCENKVRASACESAVNEKCNTSVYTGSGKEKCQQERAADFKDKEVTLFAPQAASTDGSQCGRKNPVKTRINFGCLGVKGPEDMGPVEDLLYSLIRFLSAGIGVVLVIFIILAGIQYSASEGNPEATQNAKNKIRDAIIGLFIYLIAYAFVQFLVPGGIFASTMFVPDTVNYIIQVIL